AAPAAAAPAASSKFAMYDGNRVRYESVGSGREAIVLVHGWSGDTSVWRFQVPELAKRARVIAIDLPGHGASDKPETAYTMDFFAAAVEAVMHDAGVDRAVLAGHSMGTPVIRQFYRLYPDKTLALVAVDGALQNLYSGMLDPLIAQLREPGYKEVAAKFVSSMFFNPGTETVRDATLASTLATPQHVLVGSFEGMREPAIWKDDPIGVPLLVVNAKAPFWTPEYVEYVRKLAPQVDYRVIEGPGHFLMLEKPAEFNAALLDFLQKQKLLGG
ncbi:MAG: alpha/beta hydrolase, partial [Acidobacteriota bacterium]|nr:alpha/beta hydrolase [Acidobacteriota bacterium]